MFVVERTSAHVMDKSDLQALQAIANTLAIALDHVLVHEDLTRHAAWLQFASSQLDEANQLKDHMLQNISHELRLPLTIVKGYLALILDGAMGALPAALDEALATMSRRTDEIVAIVERVTTLHGLRLARLQVERVCLSDLTRSVAARHTPAIQSAGQRLSLELPDDDLHVQGNAEQLAQVMDSLLDNAIKFNAPGGSITLRMNGGVGLVSVEVIDTGIGIPAAKLDRVWDYFYQVDGSTTRPYGGLGMGLALVKNIVEAHGGAVWVRSVEGHGSTFGFGLRRAP
jgi:signal transduction histidine kinase